MAKNGVSWKDYYVQLKRLVRLAPFQKVTKDILENICNHFESETILGGLTIKQGHERSQATSVLAVYFIHDLGFVLIFKMEEAIFSFFILDKKKFFLKSFLSFFSKVEQGIPSFF